jgi:hypothetical protein
MVVPSAAILVFFIMVINVVGAARLIGIYLLLELYSVFLESPHLPRVTNPRLEIDFGLVEKPSY